jgi:hypothetical protein
MSAKIMCRRLKNFYKEAVYSLQKGTFTPINLYWVFVKF